MNEDKLLKLVLGTKARLLLKKSRVQCQVQLTDDIIKHTDTNKINEIVLHDICLKVSREIMNNFSGHIKEEGTGPGLTKKIDLMVVPTDSFKLVLEETIRLTSKRIIDEIRKDIPQ